MYGLKRMSVFSFLLVLIMLKLLVSPVFSISLHNNSEATKINLPEAEVADETAVFQKGLSYSAWSSEAFGGSESDESLDLLTETNTEWIAICFSWFQSSTTSHDIYLDSNNSPSITSVQHAITTAHNLGLKIMLKPMVEALEREEMHSYPVWRGEIQPNDEWFLNYSTFINFFATFAEQNNVEMFCVGCEYKETTEKIEKWKSVIQGVRERYTGPITYAADWTNYQNIEWWDSVDYVGIDAYFPLTLFNSDPTFEDLITVWNNNANEIEDWHATVNKPVIFTEIGYRSGDGTSMAPSNYWTDMIVDLQEQKDCYTAAFQTLWNRNWFYGFYWWTWVSNPAEGGLYDSGHVPQNKPVQDVITHWYSLERHVAIIDQTFISDEKCRINEVQSVGFHIRWVSNDADVVDASVFVNGSEHVTNKTGWISFNTSYATVGKRSWSITDVQHPELSRYIMTAESPNIIWDKLQVNIEADPTGFGVTYVRVNATYVFTGDLVTDVVTVVNGKPCKETEPAIYETRIDSWSPYQQVTVQIDTANWLGETWSTTVINPLNMLVYVLVFIGVILIVVMLVKRWKKPQPAS